jgi:hypothetical protein
MGLIGSLWARSAGALDRRVGWDRLPKPLGVLTLVGLRTGMRRRNLYDTNTAAPVAPPPPLDGDRHLRARTLDGTWNDLDEPRMGAIGARFGRNVPLSHTFPQDVPALLDPSPREVSRRLLTRETFAPATTLNVLAAAWLQFEVHDWFSHGENQPDSPWTVDLGEGDPWTPPPMQIPRTRRDPTSDDDPSTPPTYATADSHWWDASQIYGSDPAFAAALRGDNGRLRLDEGGLLPADLEKHVDPNGVGANFWIGLGVLHTLFTAEHNAICDRLEKENPGWSEDRLYDTARLVNAALMAKIHTVEWTPGIIAHPTTQYAMRANWYGILGKRLGKRSSNEVLGGIPGSPTDHHGVPYSLTEEFVAVYRMHPLLPDDFTFRSLETDEVLQERTFREVGARDTRTRLEELGMPNALYSLGVSHPGAIELHNYPRFLQELRRPNGDTIDLAATDVLRVRERGVPRYTEFRRLLGLKPPKSFEELTDNAAWREELRAMYRRPEQVDTMIGLYSERKPKGFGFSDTAFRVFILMASRRLKSDRFFTRDFTEDVYSRAGLDWIDQNSLVTVLLRHYPSLAPSLQGVQNGFGPWRRVTA